MKNILIASHNLGIGGAERSLLGLLNSIDYTRYNVDLVLYRHSGELMSLLPKQVNLLPEDKNLSSIAIPIIDVLKKGNIPMVAARLIGKIRAKLYRISNSVNGECQVEIEYSHKYTKYLFPRLQKQYDLAISFLTPHYFVKEKVKSDKKVAWIHTDYSTINIDEKSELKMWSSFDYIISISNACTMAFIKKFPELEKKILLIENILDPNFIKHQADLLNVDDEMYKNKDEYIFCSVGRFSMAKNFDNIPIICRKLIDKGYKIKWYIVGYGGDELLIRKNIENYKVYDNVIILGKKDNPYPYIKKCDIYIQPSRYEGKAVTVREAQILEKPVIITSFPTSNSQLNNGYDGLIMPLENDLFVEEIEKILDNPKVLEYIKYNCSISDYSNKNEIEKIYEILED